jgi:hypothetical protein
VIEFVNHLRQVSGFPPGPSVSSTNKTGHAMPAILTPRQTQSKIQTNKQYIIEKYIDLLYYNRTDETLKFNSPSLS